MQPLLARELGSIASALPPTALVGATCPFVPSARRTIAASAALSTGIDTWECYAGGGRYSVRHSEGEYNLDCEKSWYFHTWINEKAASTALYGDVMTSSVVDGKT
eukprot:scaffold235890_cov33-Tisochrysis_lutea.AAC.2